MPTYEQLKAAIVAEVEAEYSTDPPTFARLRAALGDQGSSAPWPTVVVASVELPDPDDLEAPAIPTEIRALVGSGWAPPADPQDPSAGPDPALVDQTEIAAIVRGIAAYLESEWKPRINALVAQVNASHGTALEEVP